jgi:Helix-turn-helix domain
VKFLYTIKETKVALARGTTSVYKLINEGRLDAVKFGRQTYIKARSIDALIDALEPIQTPTMKAALEAQAERDTPQPLEATQSDLSVSRRSARSRFGHAVPRSTTAT